MAENKGYMTLSDEQGSIHISEEVIAAIAVGAVREVEGRRCTKYTLPMRYSSVSGIRYCSV